ALSLVERVFLRTSWERKRAITLRHVLRLALEITTALVGLGIFFGQPTQLFTVIGLAGAGLAVAFQDAILSVAGWFVLMGHAGVHLGDWVEINGVVGEVIEIRLLKTVLMETGNWIAAGHPTGRRVFFPNSFALKGSYFNFSTVGQWLWDEVQVQLPAGSDAHRAATVVEQALQEELREPAERAGHEWQHWHRDAPYSTAPTVQLRPEGGQFNLVVRYTTPAQERSATRERLWRVITHGLEEAGRPRSQEASQG
ncbi:MAG: mechanosensitive ion channel family protein, partial [Terriglobales bacterium]